MALKRGPYKAMYGPSGGDGGVGGSIVLQADHNVICLRGLLPSYKAKRGGDGEGEKVSGKSGRDIVVIVPCGTIVRDAKTKEVLCDLVHDGERHVIARGGFAGIGNQTFKSPTNQVPRESVPGGEGEAVFAELEMKLIADVGLVRDSCAFDDNNVFLAHSSVSLFVLYWHSTVLYYFQVGL